MADRAPYLASVLERGVLVISLLRTQIEGEDLAAGLKEELATTVAQHGVNKVVLDLGRCRYVSSIAFWPLLALRRQLTDSGGKLLVTGLNGAVLDVFTTTKMVSSTGSLDAPFEMAPDRDTAVSRLAAL